MTVLTKLSTTITKTPLISENYSDELVIDVHPPACAPDKSAEKARHATGVLFCMFLAIFLLALLGVVTARQIYNQVGPSRMHYQGYCSIPIYKDTRMPESRKVALRWQDALDQTDFKSKTGDGDLQVAAVGDGDGDGDAAGMLSELLDIDLDDGLERVVVYQNGQSVSFLHDFESNVTGIVDTERCFVMEMDGESALAPQVFVVGLQEGREFDVQLVRRQLRALRPALADLARAALRGLAARCAGRPTYRLQNDNGTIIRKRAADEPQHDYIQFAGNNVQQIDISNLPELLHYEQARNQLD